MSQDDLHYPINPNFETISEIVLVGTIKKFHIFSFHSYLIRNVLPFG